MNNLGDVDGYRFGVALIELEFRTDALPSWELVFVPIHHTRKVTLEVSVSLEGGVRVVMCPSEVSVSFLHPSVVLLRCPGWSCQFVVTGPLGEGLPCRCPCWSDLSGPLSPYGDRSLGRSFHRCLCWLGCLDP